MNYIVCIEQQERRFTVWINKKKETFFIRNAISVLQSPWQMRYCQWIFNRFRLWFSLFFSILYYVICIYDHSLKWKPRKKKYINLTMTSATDCRLHFFSIQMGFFRLLSFMLLLCIFFTPLFFTNLLLISRLKFWQPFWMRLLFFFCQLCYLFQRRNFQHQDLNWIGFVFVVFI